MRFVDLDAVSVAAAIDAIRDAIQENELDEHDLMAMGENGAPSEAARLLVTAILEALDL